MFVVAPSSIFSMIIYLTHDEWGHNPFAFPTEEEHEMQDELLEEVKELRRVIHAGFVLIGARIHANYDNTKSENEYISSAVAEMQDVLSGLRQGD